MSRAVRAIIAVLIVIIVLVTAAFAYSMTGWEDFSYKTGDTPTWSSADKSGSGYSPGGIADLRYKSATFQLNVDGQIYTQDVTAVLNGMAVAYKGQPYDGNLNNGVLTLDTSLNPFSFVIAGVNDKSTISDPSVLGNATVALTGKYKVL